MGVPEVFGIAAFFPSRYTETAPGRPTWTTAFFVTWNVLELPPVSEPTYACFPSTVMLSHDALPDDTLTLSENGVSFACVVDLGVASASA